MADESRIDEAFAKALGNVLKDYRKSARLTQEQLAIKLDIDRNHYQLLEKGLSNRKLETPANPRLSTLTALSHLYGIEVPTLLSEAMDRAKSSTEA